MDNTFFIVGSTIGSFLEVSLINSRQYHRLILGNTIYSFLAVQIFSFSDRTTDSPQGSTKLYSIEVQDTCTRHSLETIYEQCNLFILSNTSFFIAGQYETRI